MAVSIPSGEPTSLRAGDTWNWYKDLADYPAGDWILTYSLVNSGSLISFDSSADGDRHLVTVDSDVTADYAAGTYTWQAHVTNADDESGDAFPPIRYTVGTGTIEILPDLTVSATDSRSHVRKVLDAIQSILEGRASTDAETLTFGDRTLVRTPIPDLIKLRAIYREELAAELAAEKRALGTGGSARIVTRFN